MKKTGTMLALHYASDPIEVDDRSNCSNWSYILYEVLLFFLQDIRASLLIIQAGKYVDWIENVQWMGSFLGLRYRLRSKFNKSRLQAKFKFHV